MGMKEGGANLLYNTGSYDRNIPDKYKKRRQKV